MMSPYAFGRERASCILTFMWVTVEWSFIICLPISRVEYPSLII